MKRLLFTLITVFIFQSLIFGQKEATTADGKLVLLYDNGTWKYADSIPVYSTLTNDISKLELPKTNTNDIIINHSGYSLLYNEPHEQASWVAYELTKEETNKLYDRTDKFVPDPYVKTKTANDDDYAGAGYDRGHLAPASDMGWSATAMAESFYYSNMSPQTASFNRGIWKKLEEQVRSWAIENEKVYVITGPVLKSGLPFFGANKVSIPKYFYKVILDYTKPGIKGIGFILPNTGSTMPLQSYAVSIDSVEKFTEIDFFPLLPDNQEEFIEKALCFDCWNWKTNNSENNSNNYEEKLQTSVRCSGLTKAGGSCKNKTLNASGYCYLHESQQKRRLTQK
jgi:endonuclease G